VIHAYVSNTSGKVDCGNCGRPHQLRRIRYGSDGADSWCTRCVNAHEPTLVLAVDRLIDETARAIDEHRYPLDHVMSVLLPDVDESHPYPIGIPMILAAADYIAASQARPKSRLKTA
jgi:hypothetical protein